jgi:cofilin
LRITTKRSNIKKKQSKMQSGVTVDDVCVTAMNSEIKTSRPSKRYIIYTINRERIEIADRGERAETWDQFAAKLINDRARDPCYGVFDFDYHDDGVQKSRILFISWIPDGTSVRPRTIYAGTKETIKNALGGSFVSIDATSGDQLTTAAITARAVAGR